MLVGLNGARHARVFERQRATLTGVEGIEDGLYPCTRPSDSVITILGTHYTPLIYLSHHNFVCPGADVR